MKIKSMTVQDYDEVFQMWSSERGITLRSVDDSREGIEKFLQRNPTSNFVCKEKGSIVGSILCGHDGRKGFIYHLVVKRNYQKNGVGKSLVEKAVTSLKSENITKIAILVNSDNASVDIFWNKLGFKCFDDLTYKIRSLNFQNI